MTKRRDERNKSALVWERVGNRCRKTPLRAYCWSRHEWEDVGHRDRTICRTPDTFEAWARVTMLVTIATMQQFLAFQMSSIHSPCSPRSKGIVTAFSAYFLIRGLQYLRGSTFHQLRLRYVPLYGAARVERVTAYARWSSSWDRPSSDEHGDALLFLAFTRVEDASTVSMRNMRLDDY